MDGVAVAGAAMVSAKVVDIRSAWDSVVGGSATGEVVVAVAGDQIWALAGSMAARAVVG